MKVVPGYLCTYMYNVYVMYVSLKSRDYHMTRPVAYTHVYIPVSSNSHALIDTIGCMRDDIIEFIRHTSRSRHICNTGVRAEDNRNFNHS